MRSLCPDFLFIQRPLYHGQKSMLPSFQKHCLTGFWEEKELVWWVSTQARGGGGGGRGLSLGYLVGSERLGWDRLMTRAQHILLKQTKKQQGHKAGCIATNATYLFAPHVVKMVNIQKVLTGIWKEKETFIKWWRQHTSSDAFVRLFCCDVKLSLAVELPCYR